MITDWKAGDHYQPQRYFTLGVMVVWVSGPSIIVVTPEGWVLGNWVLGWKDAGMPSNTSVKFDMTEREALFDMAKRTVKFDMKRREVEVEI